MHFKYFNIKLQVRSCAKYCMIFLNCYFKLDLIQQSHSAPVAENQVFLLCPMLLESVSWDHASTVKAKIIENKSCSYRLSELWINKVNHKLRLQNVNHVKQLQQSELKIFDTYLDYGGSVTQSLVSWFRRTLWSS